MLILENKTQKRIQSPAYNLFFDKQTGFTARWGVTKEDDPPYSPAPEILDLEISEVISADQKVESPYHIYTDDICNRNCPFCYKRNNRGGITKHLNLDGVKLILDKMRQPNGGYLLTQVALGITSSDSHPQLFEIAAEFKNRQICCNLTCNGVGFTDDLAQKYVKHFNAIAVSVNSRNKEEAYNTIQKLTTLGCKQTNVHFVIAEESFEEAKQLIGEVATDTRLKNLNAVVLLAFKDKQKTGVYMPIKSVDRYRDLLRFAESRRVKIGLDSCSGPVYLSTIRGDKDEKKLAEVVETCCACRFSSYISCNMDYFPCSFLEGVEEWETGLNLTKVSNFSEIWDSARVEDYRKYVIGCGEKRCPCHYFD